MPAVPRATRGGVLSTTSPFASVIPAHLTINRGVLTKVKTWRTDCRSQILRFLVLGDSNSVPIDAVADSSRHRGAFALIDRAMMVFRKNASLRPQGLYIQTAHGGGGIKPLDTFSKDFGSNVLSPVFRGDGVCYANIGGVIPAFLAGLMFPKVASGHRVMYAIIDTRTGNQDPASNGPIEFRDMTKVYIEYGANAPASGNQPTIPNGAQLLDGSGVIAGAETGIDLGTCLAEAIDASALTLANPLSAANIIALDALAATGVGTSSTTINGANGNGFYWGGNKHATALTLQANKINVVRMTVQANKQFCWSGIWLEDGNTTGVMGENNTMSGLSDGLTRFNNYDAAGANTDSSPLSTTFAYAMWLNRLIAVPNTPSHVVSGCNFIMDLDFANDIAGGKSPAYVAAMFKDKVVQMEASASGAKGIVGKAIWCPEAAVGNEDGFITGTGTGTTSGYKYSDYLAALKAVVALYPNTAFLISVQDYYSNLLPSVIQNQFNDTGIYGAVGASDLLHRNVFSILSPIANTIEQLVVRMSDAG